MKNKGFTLVEMLAVLVILGLLIGIGVFTVNNIRDNAEKNYYVSMEDTLKIAGNDYFNDNREDRPIDDYNFVSLETLEDHEYLDVLKTYDKKEDCDKSSGVYIYNTENGNEYEVCLKCGIHKSTGPYCNGKKTGQIMITGSTNTGSFYNPTLSYVGTPWSNASYINVTFKLMGDDVSTNKFEIYNGNTNALDSTCTSISANSCTSKMSVTGSYYVIAYNGSEKVGNRKYFNIKIDNTPPTFDIKDQENEKDLGDGYEFPYNNEVINIHDDNGYKSAVFSLKELVDTNPSVNIVNKDLTASNLQIFENLSSGKYRLVVTVTDYANNSTTKSIEFAIKYNVDMIYFDNTEKKHEIGTIRVYRHGLYEGLLTEIDVNGSMISINWYDNTNYGGDKYSSSTPVEKTSRHALYGRENRGTIPVANEPHCENNNDFTYNGQPQTLVQEKTGYHLTNNVQTEADTYTIIAMPDADYTWADNTRTYKMIQCTIKPYKVEFNPSVNPCKKDLIYNADTQQLVNLTGHEAHVGDSQAAYRLQWNSYDIYTITPYVGKDAGSYDVKYHLLSSNFVWNDGTSDDHEYTCSIGKYPAKFPVKCSVPYGGLTNQANHDYAVPYLAFDGEPATIIATPTKIKSGSGNDMIYVSTVTFGDEVASISNFKHSNYYIAKTPIDCTITKSPLVIVVDSAEKVYDGTALTKKTYSDKNGTAAEYGDTITSVTITGSQTNVGKSNNVGSKAVIKNGTKTVTKYYNIKYENGTLEVTPCKIVVTATNQSKTYNGKALTASATCSAEGLPAKHTVTCENSGSRTSVGESTKSLDKVIVKKGSTTVTKNFEIEKNNGTLKVKVRAITVKCTNQSKTYNGKALTATNKCSVTSTLKVASGQTMTCKCSGSITNPGVETKVIESVSIKDSSGKSVKDNYEVTEENGTLTVNKRAVTIKCDNQSKEYDGTALTADNKCSVTSTIKLLSGHKASCTCSGSQTAIGESTKKMESVAIKKGSTNVGEFYDITTNNGTLTVNKRALTVTATDQSKTYNGSALTANNECKITSGSLLSGHSISCTCSGSQTSVGESTKTLSTVTVSPSSAAGYYNITKKNGTLTVKSDTPPDVTTCNKYYYQFSYSCEGATGEYSHTAEETGKSSESDATTACTNKLKSLYCPEPGTTVGSKPSSCSGYVHVNWSIGYKDSSGASKSGGPYSTWAIAKALCAGKLQCHVTCG